MSPLGRPPGPSSRLKESRNMKTRSSIVKLVTVTGLLAAALMTFAIAPRALAEDTVIKVSFARPLKEPIPVNVLTGQSCLILFDKPIGRLAVSNQEVAEAVLVAADQMTINGKVSGRARFTIWSKDDNQFVFLDVDVRANLAQIDSQVRALFPKEDIRLSQANGSVVISGNVDPKVAQQVETVIQAAGFKTVNLLVQPILTMTQVQLQIRVAEVSRNKLQELAFSPAVQTRPGQGGYFNTGQGPFTVSKIDQGSIFGAVAPSLNLFVMGGNDVFAFLRALQTQGALRALAEPNLIAMNGQQASFLAGGEIPIPIIQNGAGAGNAVTILFKEYGFRLNFKPTVLDEQHIRLELDPEVSTLDLANAVTFNGFVIPALRVRRAKTGIELQDGQSFGIAGLLDNTEQKSLSKIPILADVPILGNLFKSKLFQKNESELVFIVTAKITKPLNPDAMPQMKGVDGLKGSPPLGADMPGAMGSGAIGGSSGAAGGGATTSGSGGATSSVPSTSEKSTSGSGESGVKNTKSGDSSKSGAGPTSGSVTGGNGTTTSVGPSGHAMSGDSAVGARSATDGESAKSSASVMNTGSTGGGVTNNVVTNSFMPHSNDGATGARDTKGGESAKSSDVSTGGNATANVASDNKNTTIGAVPTDAKSAPGANLAKRHMRGVRLQRISSTSGGETNRVITSNFLPPGNPASVESATIARKTKDADGAKPGVGMRAGDVTNNAATNKNATKNATSGAGATSDKSAKNDDSAAPSKRRKSKSDSSSTKSVATNDNDETEKAPDTTTASSRPSKKRTIRNLSWKIRLPDLATLTAQRGN